MQIYGLFAHAHLMFLLSLPSHHQDAGFPFHGSLGFFLVSLVNLIEKGDLFLAFYLFLLFYIKVYVLSLPVGVLE